MEFPPRRNDLIRTSGPPLLGLFDLAASKLVLPTENPAAQSRSSPAPELPRLDRFQDVASVGVTPRKIAVISPCLRFVIISVASSLTIGPLLAQEAVETAKPAAEASPEESPAKKESTKADAKPSRSLEETMRPEEFKAAGLDKLSEDEMQHLDAYLQGYRQAAQKKAAEQAQAKAQDEIKKANAKADEANAKANDAQKASEQAKQDAASARTKIDALSSRVDGHIDGVSGHTIIRLEDGSVWKQVNAVDRGDDRYRATVTDRPSAVVFHTTFGYKMRIEGMPEFYVDPVVRPQ